MILKIILNFQKSLKLALNKEEEKDIKLSFYFAYNILGDYVD